MAARDFEVRRDDPRETRLTDTQSDGEELEPSELRLAVERFGLTANNVTYHLAGDSFGYWDFFPATDGWGRIPVWGYGDVVASRVENVDPGARFYGFFPMSTHVTLSARATSDGFVATSPHRAALAEFYNRYARVDAADGSADHSVVMRPLFTTAFLLDHLIGSNDCFGADTVMLSSASSKTAYALAFLLRGRTHLLGLTSERNRGFAEGLGVYDDVVAYESVERELATNRRFVYVDVSGNQRLRAEIHENAGDRLVHSLSVGATHWDTTHGPELAAGPVPTPFFAPTYAEEVAGVLGEDEMQRRIAAAWRDFLPLLDGRVDVVRRRTPGGVLDAWLAFVEGRADPRRTYVLSIP